MEFREIDIGKARKESEKEERDKEIINIQKQQTEILRKQIQITERQTFFTELMALTSIILGITAFIELLNLQIIFPANNFKIFLQFISYTIVSSIFTILIIVSVIYLCKTTIKSFMKNSKLLS
jgi:hypothetical protein